MFVLRRLSVGGAERVAADIARALAAAGAEVTVVQFSSSAGSAVSWFEGIAGILRARGIAGFSALMTTHAPDIVVLCGPSLAYKALPRVKAEHPALRVVTFMFNAQQLVEAHRALAAHIDLVIAESEVAADALVNGAALAPPVRVISSGVDLSCALSRPRPAGDGRRLTVGFMGRFDRTKNPEAFIRLARRGINLPVRWVMAGPKSLWFRIPPPVTYFGTLMGEAKERFLDGLDVLVISSRNDGRPLTLHEAQARGIVVVAFAVGAIPELITDGENGLLVPPGDDEALYRAVEKLVGDAPLRSALGVNARSRVVLQGDMARSLPRYSAAIIGHETTP